ncbi:hypothetical protein KRP22_013984 [Phytophthora ramorum]|nr:ABC transporter B family member 2 [Phytophthora ramorum]
MAPPQLHPDAVEPGGDGVDYVQVVTPRANNPAPNVPIVASKVSELKSPTATVTQEPGEAATKDKEKLPTIAFRELYRYGTTADNLLLSIGVLMAGANGALFPCMALVFGDAIGAFAQADGGVDMDAVNSAALDYMYIAIALFITDYVAYVVFVNSSERQMKALRDAAFKHMLHMNIGWYDSSDPLTLSSRLTGDTVKIKDGMGQKLGDSVKYTCQFITGYVIGFVRGWDMSLVMACVMPFMVASLGVLMTSLRKRAVHSQQMYAEAGAVAEETLGSIRTVSSLNAEKLAIDKYNGRAAKAEETNIQMAKFSSAVFGLFMCSIWLMYAAGLWYGGSKVAHGKATPSEVFQSFFGVLMGTISLGQITPNISAVAEAKANSGEPHTDIRQKRSSRSVISEHLEENKMAQLDMDVESEKPFTLFDAMAFSRPERPAFIVGIIAAAVMGCALPSSAVLISELVATMTTNYTLYKVSNVQSALDDLKHDVMVYGLCYVGGSLVMFLAASTQNYCFKYMAEKLTSRLRDIHFTALCRQNIGFFDDKKNATGALTADLSTNATKVALISGDSQGRVVQAVFTFVAALVISFTTGSWLLTLVMLAVFPFLIAGQMVRMRQMKSSGHLSDELSAVGAHASEALSNIRTVVSLGLEKSIYTKFSDLLEEPLASGRREAQLNGIALGFSSFILFATYSLVFWYGGKLVHDREINFKELMRTLMAIMMSAQGIGNATSFMGESDNALKAGKAIVDLRDRKPPIDAFQQDGRRLDQLQVGISLCDRLEQIAFSADTQILGYNVHTCSSLISTDIS